MKRLLCVLLVCVLLAGCTNTAEDWQEQYDLGMRYLDDGDYEEAILAFTAAIEIDSSRPEAYMGRAEAYIAIDEPKKAMKDYKKAKKLAEKNDDEDLAEELEELIVELEEAIAETETAGEDNPSDETAWNLSVAEVYFGENLIERNRLFYRNTGILERVVIEYQEYDGDTVYQYIYDEEDRLVNISCGEYSSIEYRYDSEGRLIHCCQVENGTVDTSYEYDGKGRLIREYSLLDTGDEEILYSYDDHGRMTGATIRYTNYYGDAYHSGTISYEYDYQNRLLASTETREEYTCRTDYSYYENAVLMEASYSDGGGWAQVWFTDASGEEQWGLDLWHMVAEVQEENGYVTGIVDTAGYVYTFAYDASDGEPEGTVPGKDWQKGGERIGLVSGIEWYDSGIYSGSYELTYDKNGLLQEIRVNQYDSTGVLVDVYIQSYQYDRNNRMTYVQMGEDAYVEYTYDEEGNLTYEYTVDGGSEAKSYAYDDQGRRIWEYSVSDFSEYEMVYYYDGDVCTSVHVDYCDYDYGEKIYYSSDIFYYYDEMGRLTYQYEDESDAAYIRYGSEWMVLINWVNYSYYEGAKAFRGEYEDGSAGMTAVEFTDATGEGRWTLYLEPGYTIREENGRIVEITSGSETYCFTYVEAEMLS